MENKFDQYYIKCTNSVLLVFQYFRLHFQNQISTSPGFLIHINYFKYYLYNIMSQYAFLSLLIIREYNIILHYIEFLNIF